MPHTVQWKDDSTLITFNGNVTFRDVREVGDAHYGDPTLEAIQYVIADFRDADCSPLSPQEIKIISAFDSATVAYKKELKIALVANDETTRKVCEAYRASMLTLQSSWPVAIFATLEEAQNWCRE